MSKELTVIEQREVEFYDDQIVAVLVDEDGRRAAYIPIRPMTRLLGVNWDGQRRRILRDPVSSTVVKGVVVTTTPGALCAWGSRHTAYQQMQVFPMVSRAAAQQQVEKIVARQVRRGYRVVVSSGITLDMEADAVAKTLLPVRE